MPATITSISSRPSTSPAPGRGPEPRRPFRDNPRLILAGIAVLLGAYLGEVFCRASAGTGWISLDQVQGPDDYVIALRNGSHAKPVAEMLSRFGRVAKVRLSDYLRDVMLASRPPV